MSAQVLKDFGAKIDSFDLPEPNEAWLYFLKVNSAGDHESIPKTLGNSKGMTISFCIAEEADNDYPE